MQFKDDQQARNVIIPMILSESTSSIHKTSLLIGIHHQNLTLGIDERLSFESQTNNALWPLCEVKEEKYISSRDSWCRGAVSDWK